MNDLKKERLIEFFKQNFCLYSLILGKCYVCPKKLQSCSNKIKNNLILITKPNRSTSVKAILTLENL